MVCTWKFSMLFGKCCQSREVTRTKSRRRIVRGDKFYLPYSSFSAPGSPRFANGLDDDESSATATSNSYHAVHGEEAVAEPVESAPETPIVKSTAELVSNALDPPVVMTVEEPGTANETKSVQVDDAAQAKKPLQKDDGQHLTIAANTAFPTDAPTVPEKDDWMPRTVTANTAFPADALTTSTPEAPQTSFSEAKRADWLQNSRKQYEERMASAALKQRQRQEEAEVACFSDVDQPHRGDGLGPTLARIVGFGGEQHVASDPEVYQALARSRWQSSTHEVGLQTKVLGTWQAFQDVKTESHPEAALAAKKLSRALRKQQKGNAGDDSSSELGDAADGDFEDALESPPLGFPAFEAEQQRLRGLRGLGFPAFEAKH